MSPTMAGNAGTVRAEALAGCGPSCAALAAAMPKGDFEALFQVVETTRSPLVAASSTRADAPAPSNPPSEAPDAPTGFTRTKSSEYVAPRAAKPSTAATSITEAARNASDCACAVAPPGCNAASSVAESAFDPAVASARASSSEMGAIAPLALPADPAATPSRLSRVLLSSAVEVPVRSPLSASLTAVAAAIRLESSLDGTLAADSASTDESADLAAVKAPHAAASAPHALPNRPAWHAH
mmetsp:Transcript_24627/g.93090  ORF Transcript_24627/g.93090 Transcript_24627/m.93090 type:complete len:240 (-) Transcript_24627:448-1167(-)